MTLKIKRVDILEILKIIGIKKKIKKKIFISGINNIHASSKGDLTICNSDKYLEYLKKTKSSACFINEKYLEFVPKNCYPIISSNPDLDFIKIGNFFFQEYIFDQISKPNLELNIIKKNKKLSFGINFICENNVKFGKNVSIGHNVIIKKDCIIGSNVNIGSNVVISNSIVGNNVNIGDGSVIGKKGFGFKFYDNLVYRVPHIGKVIIEDNAEIGSNCNIDRGSISNTTIGKFTFLDNQVHIAHNVKIGNYCILAAQVGIAGSTKIGNNVTIGGQSGISGHLKIGDNVKIAGKSGVIRDLEDNKVVMGYPSEDIKEFVKKNKYVIKKK